jgi:glutamyl-tRNA synthetase
MVEGVDRDCEGYAERNAVSDIGKVVQFERFAFCRIEEMDTVLKCIYTHP